MQVDVASLACAAYTPYYARYYTRLHARKPQHSAPGLRYHSSCITSSMWGGRDARARVSG